MAVQSGKLLIFSAPSGSGKSTLIRHLVERNHNLVFSVSATSRAPRGAERDGVEYHFLTLETFRAAIQRGEFLEYEEVYPNCFYGTLRSEVDGALQAGRNIVLDVDVKGGINIKRIYGSQALSVFVKPPSIEVLRQRLLARATDMPAMIEKRVAKAAWELQFAPQFDCVIVNDSLERAKQQLEQIINDFLRQ